MIGNNSCGVHSVMGRRTVDNVHKLEVLTYSGWRGWVGETPNLAEKLEGGGDEGALYRGMAAVRDRYAADIRARYPGLPRRVSGFNLNQLLPEHGFQVARALVGSEGTCTAVLEAELRLLPHPRCRALLVLGYPDIFAAAGHVCEVLACEPIGLEAIDAYLIRLLQEKHLHADSATELPEGEGWLLAEFGADSREEAEAAARRAQERIRDSGKACASRVVADEQGQERIWAAREASLGATAIEGGRNVTWEGWEDAAVPPERLDAYLCSFKALLERYGYKGSLYGHFGDGCVHTRINFDLKTAAGIAKYRRFIEEASELVIAHGGSLSGEHGDGQSRAVLLRKMYGDRLVEGFSAFKHVWDPLDRMNPGKVVDPFSPTENLRLGVDYNPPDPKTHFAYPDDAGSFAEAALRCVGVGACRKMQGGVMCPSWRVTQAEEHATRGRAHLLFEMLRGEIITEGWRSPAVKDALDLCLGCKACVKECPVQVDLATYKAEFLAHYYSGRLRPRAAYVLGWVDRWAPLAKAAAPFVNAMTSKAGELASRVVGLDPKRALPRLRRHSFRRWASARASTASGPQPALLWADTFNEHFRPKTGRAAWRVLERLGFAPYTPLRQLCCGRPLYDFGMLHAAKRKLRTILAALREDIRAGVPVVVLEPSCASVFRHELIQLFPHDEDAKRLQGQTFLFSEFLAEHCDRLPKDATREVLLHGHCHQKSVLDWPKAQTVVARIAAEHHVPDVGCCGLAGSFGYEHFELSARIGELGIVPHARAAPEDCSIVTEGFSCRTQMEELTGRRVLHLAEWADAAFGAT